MGLGSLGRPLRAAARVRPQRLRWTDGRGGCDARGSDWCLPRPIPDETTSFKANQGGEDVPANTRAMDQLIMVHYFRGLFLSSRQRARSASCLRHSMALAAWL